MERFERTVWRSVDVVLYPSDDESAAVTSLEPGVNARTLLPYCFADFAAPRMPPISRTMLFVAGFAHCQTNEAASWFVEHVLPLVCVCVPDARLAIVGSNPSPEVLALASSAVNIHANVSEAQLREHYQQRARRCGTAALRRGREAEGGGGIARRSAAGHYVHRRTRHFGN